METNICTETLQGNGTQVGTGGTGKKQEKTGNKSTKDAQGEV